MQRYSNETQAKLGDPQTILESITDAFFSLTGDWEFSYVNRQAEKTLGRQADDLIGKNIWEEYPSALGSDFERMYRKAARERVAVTFNSYFPDHARWYEVHVYPAPEGLSVYFRDATERILAEEKLRQSEMRFRLMADSIPQIVWITNAAGKAEFFNAQWSEYTGVPFQTATAEDVSLRFVHPDDHLPTMHAWNEAQQARRTFKVEHRILSAAGEYRWFLVRAEPYHDPQTGELIRWFGTSTDVHDKKLAEAALQRSEGKYRALFDSIDAGFCIIQMIFDHKDEPVDYRFCEVNAMFEQQSGLREAYGKTARELMPNLESHWFEIYGSVARTGQSIRFENESKVMGRWFAVYAFLVEEAGADKVAVLFSDITERKIHEADVQRTSRLKDEFLAMLAHELRNPLAPIGAAAELLQLVPLDERCVKQTSDVIARQVTHMAGLLDDLLDVSRVTRGQIKLEMSVQDMKHVAAEAIEQVRPAIESRKHHLAVLFPPEPATVRGDQKRLIQVVVNLLTNAAKYTPERGQITLKIEVQDKHVMLCVADNGIGMEAEFVASAFEMFSQAQRSADRSQGGLGIGLALVKSLVLLHEGSVTVHSQGVGEGSEFKVRLPCIEEPVKAGAQQNRQVQSHRKAGLRIMVVDDNVDAACMLAMYLKATGHDVATEHEPRQAMERARTEHFDAFTLDIGLPDMDGNELARRLRAHPESAAATLIAISGYGQEQDRNQSIAAGFDHYLVKPIDLAKLGALLRQIDDRKRNLLE